MELRAIYEKQDEGIDVDFKLINTTREAKEITFPSGQQFEMIIVDDGGEEVYRFSEGRFFTMAMTSKQLQPGEVLHWKNLWKCIDKNGKKRKEGNYKVIVKIKAMVEEVSEEELTTEIDFNL
ncbi:BsuPI-related putative proteinase inhibitor [Alkaliphilus hydrothermalis]|uniref:Intracellular proteinase inhibitor BsuPI domain-containing protein n=1 Tax=Alkaliphilus hydrothermalis TaxID=1482730 RepID=A0ABS2NQH1_9FIRM|nr:BsuPI-related putative proteinase inhibitor [Alkaliphilus hydrothermalis]MBM7615195.1 hypothetical protein [Alkaliphilus hydrothermalis]